MVETGQRRGWGTGLGADQAGALLPCSDAGRQEGGLPRTLLIGAQTALEGAHSPHGLELLQGKLGLAPCGPQPPSPPPTPLPAGSASGLQAVLSPSEVQPFPSRCRAGLTSLFRCLAGGSVTPQFPVGGWPSSVPQRFFAL